MNVYERVSDNYTCSNDKQSFRRSVNRLLTPVREVCEERDDKLVFENEKKVLTFFANLNVELVNSPEQIKKAYTDIHTCMTGKDLGLYLENPGLCFVHQVTYKPYDICVLRGLVFVDMCKEFVGNRYYTKGWYHELLELLPDVFYKPRATSVIELQIPQSRKLPFQDYYRNCYFANNLVYLGHSLEVLRDNPTYHGEPIYEASLTNGKIRKVV